MAAAEKQPSSNKSEERSNALDKEEYKKGRVIFSQGDTGDTAFIVESGSVGIFKILEGDEKVHLATLEPGQLFGEMAVIDGSKRMAAAVVMEDSVLVKVPRDAFDAKMEQYDPFMRALIEILINNLRTVHGSYMKRPRSVRDLLSVQSVLYGKIQEYAYKLEDEEAKTNALEQLGIVEQANKKMASLLVGQKDRRKSVMTDSDD